MKHVVLALFLLMSTPAITAEPTAHDFTFTGIDGKKCLIGRKGAFID